MYPNRSPKRAHAGSAESIGPDKRRELGALVNILYLGRPELVDGLVLRSDTEVGLQRVGDPLSQGLSGVPVNDRHWV